MNNLLSFTSPARIIAYIALGMAIIFIGIIILNYYKHKGKNNDK